MQGWDYVNKKPTQATETWEGSTSVGAPSYPQLGKSWHHLPADEMTYWDCKGEGPVYGSQHGEDSWSLHFIEDVDLIRLDQTHHRHPENIAKLDRFPTSHSSDSPSNCRSLCTKKTDHQTSQPMMIKAQNNDYLDRQGNFGTSLGLRDEETFCSWGRCWRSKSVCWIEQ